MGERYQEVFRLENSLYASDCPMIIEVGVLQKDNKENKIIAQIKVRNIGSKTIIAYKISLKAYEVSGEELQRIENFSFMDMNLPYGVEGGSRTPIILPDNSTRSFEPSITEIVFKDKTIWRGSSEWEPVPEARKLKDVLFDDEILKQYSTEVHGDCTFYPERENGIFQCTCGAVISAHEETCYKCKRSVKLLIDNLDIDTLKQKKIEQEYKSLISKYEKSDSAEELITLSKDFEKLIPYEESEKYKKDSLDKAEEINNRNYEIAKNKMKESDSSEGFIDAEKEFIRLGEYRDSSELAEECRKQGEAKKSKELEEKKKKEKKAALQKKLKGIAVVAAIIGLIVLAIGFTQYSKYKNVDTLCNNGQYEEALNTIQNEDIPYEEKLKYKIASSLFSEERYDEAKAIYTEMGGYADCDLKVNECVERIQAIENERVALQIEETHQENMKKYEEVCNLINAGKESEAITIFASITDDEIKEDAIKYFEDILKDKVKKTNSKLSLSHLKHSFDVYQSIAEDDRIDNKENIKEEYDKKVFEIWKNETLYGYNEWAKGYGSTSAGSSSYSCIDDMERITSDKYYESADKLISIIEILSAYNKNYPQKTEDTRSMTLYFDKDTLMLEYSESWNVGTKRFFVVDVNTDGVIVGEKSGIGNIKFKSSGNIEKIKNVLYEEPITICIE